MPISWINGDVRNCDGAVSALDRGFLLGDGAFETFLVDGRSARFVKYHLERLNAGLEALCIKYEVGEELLRGINEALLTQLDHASHRVLRLTVTRGDGGRGLSFGQGVTPNIVATMSEIPTISSKVSMMAVTDFVRQPGRFSDFKSIAGYQGNIIARLQAQMENADDALLLGSDGNVVCASSSNIFAIDQQGNVSTPSVEQGALPGVVRRVLLENSSSNRISIEIKSIDVNSLRNIGLVSTNSLIGVQQVSIKGAQPLNQIQNERIWQLKSMYDDAVVSDREAVLAR